MIKNRIMCLKRVLLRYISFFYLLGFISVTGVFGKPAVFQKDTIPPSGQWISPEPNSVISTNQVRVAIKAEDDAGGSGIEKVVFYAQYYDMNEVQVPREKIGTLFKPPYELLWNCHHIPDQQFKEITLYCEIFDKAGNIQASLRSPRGDLVDRWNAFILDRNKNFSDLNLNSHYTRHPPHIDGRLDDWPALDSAQFQNNDNRIIIRSQYDAQFLYFAVEIYDNKIINQKKPDHGPYAPMYQDDHLEIFLDPDHDRNEIMVSRHRQYVFFPNGVVYEFKRDTAYYEDLRKLPLAAITVKPDTMWIIETAIKWEYLGVDPASGKTLGLEMYNSDRDFADGISFRARWTKIKFNHTLLNSSEWGNLTLLGRDQSRTYALIIFLSLAAIAALIAWRIRAKNAAAADTQPAQPPPTDVSRTLDNRIKLANTYIEKNLAQKITLEAAAEAACMSASHFAKLFKEQMGETFGQHVLKLRLQGAREEIMKGGEKLSAIAERWGFFDSTHLINQYKKMYGQTPGVDKRSQE
jgi:AraC-like DNA-binding protein